MHWGVVQQLTAMLSAVAVGTGVTGAREEIVGGAVWMSDACIVALLWRVDIRTRAIAWVLGATNVAGRVRVVGKGDVVVAQVSSDYGTVRDVAIICGHTNQPTLTLQGAEQNIYKKKDGHTCNQKKIL